MTNFAHGREAEAAAADFLKEQGYKILAQNWQTRWCEIDLVAEKAKQVYFVEVKYRQSDKHGSGLDYITPRKLKQMRFAAEFWVQDNNWSGDYSLAAIEISGPAFAITSFIDNVQSP